MPGAISVAGVAGEVICLDKGNFGGAGIEQLSPYTVATTSGRPLEGGIFILNSPLARACLSKASCWMAPDLPKPPLIFSVKEALAFIAFVLEPRFKL
jgi:hypothetical protein